MTSTTTTAPAGTGLRSLATAAVVAVSTTSAAAAAFLLYRRHTQRQTSDSAEGGSSSGRSSTAARPKSMAQRALEEFAKRTAKDDKVHLFTLPVLFQLAPSFTPYGVRAEVFMRMHGIPYEKHTDGNPAASPNGLVPYICYKGRIVADSQQIMEFLDVEFHCQPANTALTSDGAEASDRALEAAVRAVANYCLMPAIVRSTFYEDRRRKIFRYIVSSLNIVRESNPLAFVLRFVAARLFHHIMHTRFTAGGFLALSKEQYEELFLRDLESIESLLAERPFITGSTFTNADAVLYGTLLAIMNMGTAEKTRQLAAFRSGKGKDRSRRVSTSADAAADDDVEEPLTPEEEEAILDAIYVNDTVTYLHESEVLNAYMDRITSKAFPDMAEVLNGLPVHTVTAHSHGN